MKTNWDWYLERLNKLGFKNYQEYLKSGHWALQKRKFYLLQKKPLVCYICSQNTEQFNIHHKSYKRIGDENLKKDLVLVCRKCHELIHKMEAKLTTKFWHIPRMLKKNFENNESLKFK